MAINTEYRELLKKHGLKDKEIGEMFGYKNFDSWRTSNRKPQLIAGIIKLINHVEASQK